MADSPLKITSSSSTATPRVVPASIPLRDRVRSLRLSESEGRPSGGGRVRLILLALLGLGLATAGWFWWPRAVGSISGEPPASGRSGEQANDLRSAGDSKVSATKRDDGSKKADPLAPSSVAQPPNSLAATTFRSAEVASESVPTTETPLGALVLESKGYVIPIKRILVSPKVSGMLVTLKIEEGMHVQTGDVLGEIESIDYQSDVARAKATLELFGARLSELDAGSRLEEIKQAEAELKESQAKLTQLEADYRRTRRLRETGTATEQDFDQVSAEYQVQLQRIDRLKMALKLLTLGPREERKAQARAEIKQAEADLTKAEWRLQSCQIRSPISGTILKKNAEEGNIVNPIAFNGSFSICEMADLSKLEVDVNVQERDVAKVFAGQACLIRAEAFPDRRYSGTVTRLMPIADRAKGAIPVRVRINVPAAEQGVYLKPDMGVVVSFYADGGGDGTASAPSGG